MADREKSNVRLDAAEPHPSLARGPRMQRYRAVALAACFLASSCNAVLGIDEFPAEDGGTDATVASPDAASPQADGAVGTDGTADVFADTGDASAPGVGDASTADAPSDGDHADGSDADAGDPVVSISVGGTEACAVTASGKLYCWGPGPVGDGTTLARWQATLITKDNDGKSLPAVLSVSIGGAHACAAQSGSGGFPFCWGNNDYGQLGTGHLADAGAIVLAPVLASGAPVPPAHAIACGTFHTCGQDMGCWGSNSFGELGHTPGQGDIAIFNAPVTEANPVPEPGAISAAATALGNGFTCGVTTTGSQVACVGTNSAHQLNTLDAGPFSSSPVTTLTNIASVAAGAKHACAVDADGGGVTCWGDNSSGQLGPSGPAIGAGASAVSVRFGGSGPHTGPIAAGGNATCFYANLAGMEAVACWGANEHGQLGHPPATDPNQSCPGNNGPCNSQLSTIAGLSEPITALAMGPLSTCALKSDHTVWCWGSASLVGNGVASPDASTIQFTPVQVQGLPPP